MINSANPTTNWKNKNLSLVLEGKESCQQLKKIYQIMEAEENCLSQSVGEQTHPVDGLPSGIPVRVKMVRYEGCHHSDTLNQLWFQATVAYTALPSYIRRQRWACITYNNLLKITPHVISLQIYMISVLETKLTMSMRGKTLF